MRYAQYKAFDKHLQSAAPSNFCSLYCLIIKDPGERIFVFNEIKNKVKADSVSFFDGASESQFYTALETLPLFGGKQILCLQGSEKLSKTLQGRLEKTFAELPSDVMVVLTAESLSKQGSFYKAIDKHGVIFDAGEEKSWEKEKGLAEWVSERALQANKKVAPEAVNALARGVQGSFSQAAAEWEKLLTYVGERNAVTLSDVQAVCRLTQTDSTWFFGESVLALNAKEALEAVFRQLDQGGSPFPILRQLRHQMTTALFLITGTQEEIHQKLPYLKGQMLDKQQSSARRFGEERLLAAIRAIDELEFKAKDSLDDPKLLFTLLCIRIFP